MVELSIRLKKSFIKLLIEDSEFRYAILGAIGLEDLKRSHLKLEEIVASLAEAQRRIGERMEQFTNGLIILQKTVEELSIAQKKTEERVELLAKQLELLVSAQKRTEERIELLASAQERTEETLRNLAIQVGRLSDVVGFGLEDVARVVVPGWLHRYEDVEVDELKRMFFQVDSERVEINLYGEGFKAGEKVTILGEVKSRIYKEDVEGFLKKLEKVEKLIDGEKLRIMFGYFIHPSAEKIARENKIKLVASYMK